MIDWFCVDRGGHWHIAAEHIVALRRSRRQAFHLYICSLSSVETFRNYIAEVSLCLRRSELSVEWGLATATVARARCPQVTGAVWHAGARLSFRYYISCCLSSSGNGGLSFNQFQPIPGPFETKGVPYFVCLPFGPAAGTQKWMLHDALHDALYAALYVAHAMATPGWRAETCRGWGQ
jgi:hypothetical protein